jgi:hypothetical protein
MTDEKIRLAMESLMETAKIVGPMSAKIVKGYYDDGIRAGLTQEQAWEFAMHGLKNTSATV